MMGGHELVRKSERVMRFRLKDTNDSLECGGREEVKSLEGP